MQSHASSAQVLSSLLAAERQINSSTQNIGHILRKLVDNASNRIEAVARLEGFRSTRDGILQLEGIVQERNREQLAQAKKEVDLQEQWRDEITALWVQAEGEGIALARLAEAAPVPEDQVEDSISATSSLHSTPLRVAERSLLDTGEDDEGSPAGSPSRESEEPLSLSQEERIRLYRVQLQTLREASRSSERRMNALLSRIRTAQSISTTRAELIRLQSLANSTTVWLAELSVERDRATRELLAVERERVEADELAGRLVLDLVLRWRESKLSPLRSDPMVNADSTLDGGALAKGMSLLCVAA
ncbi:hypothetical protein T439DRAFT_376502 [Meredithblackwellia eburnea MCA 4105]